MVIYFTGTGNSQYVAEAIADRLDDVVVSANRYIKNRKRGSFTSQKPYVFVFPIYLSTSPAIFRAFIKVSRFSGNQNAYAVPTCASITGAAANSIDELCRESGFFRYRGCRKVIMPQNYIAYFKMSDEETQKNRLQEALTTVDEICECIRKEEDLSEKMAGKVEYGATKIVENLYNGAFTRTAPFHATDSCIGCGACERMCPTNSIRMQDDAPVWVKKTCIHCMACINRCPKEAIEFGKGTVGKKRYRCPKYVPSVRSD